MESSSLGSLNLLPSARLPLPNKVSCFISMGVFSDDSFLSVRQEPTLRPWHGVPIPATTLWLLLLRWELLQNAYSSEGEMNSRVMELEGSGITPSMHRMGRQAKWGLQDSMCASTLLILPFSQISKVKSRVCRREGGWPKEV